MSGRTDETKASKNTYNMKNCIIIHGCPSDEEKAMNPETRTYDKHWMPWVKKQLIANGIETTAPLMPLPWEPSYERFKEAFEKYPVNENTILIGHSCGCAFLVRWLGETKSVVDKLILVAPWKTPDGTNPFKTEFYGFTIDPTIALRVNRIIMFTADDEEEDGKKGLKMYHDVLGGKIIELPGRGHYILGDMGTTQFPELLEEILKD